MHSFKIINIIIISIINFIKIKWGRSLCGDKTSQINILSSTQFNDANDMFNMHFIYQWLSTKLLPLILASILQVSIAFARWLLNLPTENKIVQCDLYEKRDTLAISHIIYHKECYTWWYKKQTFFIKFPSAIQKIADGYSLFESANKEVLELQIHIKEY